jgi:uncharacterized protein YbaP (TraB family)
LLFAIGSAPGCVLWEPATEPDALPTLEIPAPEFRAPEPQPDLGFGEKTALWRAEWAIGSFYLFGSTELAPERGYASFGPTVEAAYAESEEVVHEVDLAAVKPAQAVALMRRYGTLRAPATLRSRVSPETWELLEQKFAESGRSPETVRSMQPWLVSFALANHAPIEGRDPLVGIAERVQERAKREQGTDTKPVVGLRTLASQFEMFAALPKSVQDAMLRSALGSDAADELLSRAPEFLPRIASASPDHALLYEHLIYRRNEQMAERLFQIGIDGKTRFVAVGILHLVGVRGIPSLLAQRGFRVRRVQ